MMAPVVLIQGLPADVTCEQVRVLCEAVVGKDVLGVDLLSSALDNGIDVPNSARAEVTVSCNEALRELIATFDCRTVSLFQSQERATQLFVSAMELF